MSITIPAPRIAVLYHSSVCLSNGNRPMFRASNRSYACWRLMPVMIGAGVRGTRVAVGRAVGLGARDSGVAVGVAVGRAVGLGARDSGVAVGVAVGRAVGLGARDSGVAVGVAVGLAVGLGVRVAVGVEVEHPARAVIAKIARIATIADMGAPSPEWEKPLSLLPSPYAGRRRGHVMGAHSHSPNLHMMLLTGDGQVVTQRHCRPAGWPRQRYRVGID